MISLSLLRDLADDISDDCNSFTTYSHQSAISRIRRPVVKNSHGTRITSTRSLRTAGMSPETFGSLSKNRCRLRKIYMKATMFTVRKNVAAIRRAGRAAELISDSMSYSFVWVTCIHDLLSAKDAFAATACASRRRARGVLRTSLFFFSNRG